MGWEEPGGREAAMRPRLGPDWANGPEPWNRAETMEGVSWKG